MSGIRYLLQERCGIGHIPFPQKILAMGIHRGLGDKKGIGDLLAAQSLHEASYDIPFAACHSDRAGGQVAEAPLDLFTKP